MFKCKDCARRRKCARDKRLIGFKQSRVANCVDFKLRWSKQINWELIFILLIDLVIVGWVASMIFGLFV